MKKILLLLAGSFVLLIGLAILASLLFAGFDSGGKTFSFGKKIAVIPLKGEITSEASEYAPYYSSDELVETLDDAASDDSIGAILLDIDSPGGDVVPSKQLVYKIREIEKPVVSYIGSMGASGAYYVASATDYIVADEDSLTGSIGVLSLVPDVSGLLADFNVTVEVLQSGKNKSMGSPFTSLTEESRGILQQLLDNIFSRFKASVREFRGNRLNVARFEEIADGRVLSGEQALAVGLIDKTGTKQDAIDKASELGGIEGEPALEHYAKPRPTFLDFFLQAGSGFGKGFTRAIQAPEQSVRIQ